MAKPVVVKVEGVDKEADGKVTNTTELVTRSDGNEAKQQTDRPKITKEKMDGRQAGQTHYKPATGKVLGTLLVRSRNAGPLACEG